MFTPCAQIVRLLRPFSCRFTAPAFCKVVTLICGTILSPVRRTVALAFRAVGLHSEKTFGSYHRLLSRDRWSALWLSSMLLSLLLEILVPRDQPLVLVADEPLERRRGKRIAYKGWFRDAVRSTQSCVVTTLGVRWLCLCGLTRVPWIYRRRALPFMTLPSLSEKTCAKRNRSYRGCAGLTIDALIKVRQWIGSKRAIRLIADGGFSEIGLLHFAKSLGVTHIGRFKINAGLYDEPGEQPAGKRGKKPLKGGRQVGLKQRLTDPNTQWNAAEVSLNDGKSSSLQFVTGVSLWYVKGSAPVRLRLAPVRPGDGKNAQAAAFFSTAAEMTPEQILSLYSERWNIEVFFEEVRARMGYETQRGWTNRTIGRTTPCLFGIFSLVVLLAERMFPDKLPIRQAAWYAKEQATFRDVLSAVREHMRQNGFALADPKSACRNTVGALFHDDYRLIPAHLFAAMQDMACYAA